MRKLLSLLTFFILVICGTAHSQIITTYAGTGSVGCDANGADKLLATFINIQALALDTAGTMYVADAYCKVRKIDPSGTITLFAGGATGYTGDGGPATAAGLHQPTDVAVDKKGNVYIADNLNNCVRKVDIAGIISTFAGTGVMGYNGDGIAATAAQLSEPNTLTTDEQGNVYIGEYGDGRVRKVDTAGIITTVVMAPNIWPVTGLALNHKGDLYIAYGNNVNVGGDIVNCVRKLSAAHVLSTVAGGRFPGCNGDGIMATAATLNNPARIAIDKRGDLFIADVLNNRVRMVDTFGVIKTVAGTGGAFDGGDGIPAVDCDLYSPSALAMNAAGDLFIGDNGNERIRVVRGPVSTKNINKVPSALRVYPNPSTGIFSLKMTAANRADLTFDIINSIGQRVAGGNGHTNEELKISASLPPGVYFVSVVADGHQEYTRLVVQ